MDYTNILNTISSQLSSLIQAVQNLDISNFLELIIMILFFILFINIERGY